jgi:hypothetical protein
MISEPTYLAARMVSDTIEAHFANHIAQLKQSGSKRVSVIPTATVIEAIIDAAFWASLRKEEGRSPKISIALTPPEDNIQPLIFKSPVKFTPKNLTKLAPAVEMPGIHLGVWFDHDELYIWGTTLSIPGICFVLEVVEPGLLVIKHSRIDGFGKFVNIAILKGNDIKVIDEDSLNLVDSPELLVSLLGMPLPKFLDDSVNVLIELAVSMREHGRGGLLLVIPADTFQWHDSIVHPISNALEPPFCNIADLMQEDMGERSKPDWQDALRKAIDTVGGFTAVDGATIINNRHEMLAFGAKVTRSVTSQAVDRIIMTEPVRDSAAEIIHPAQYGGTRHLAAAQFVFDQRDAVAMVASQDGHFTIFVWSDQLNMVHAHRMDMLLL